MLPRRAFLVLVGAGLVARVSAAPPAGPDPLDGERLFFADLSAANMTKVTVSLATGHLEMRLDLKTLRLEWKLEARGLTSAPTGIHLHGPAEPGTNAPPMLDLAPEGIALPLSGSAPVTESQVQYMLQGWSYVLVQTRKNPDGEIRGKIQVRRPRSMPRA